MVASLMLTRPKSAHLLFVLAGLMAVSLGFLGLVPKIPQDQAYHLFADQRALVGWASPLGVEGLLKNPER